MDAGEYDLLETMSGQILHSMKDLIGSDTATAATGVRDNTVAAERVAAVLDLEKGPGMFCKAGQFKRFGMGYVCNICNRVPGSFKQI